MPLPMRVALLWLTVILLQVYSSCLYIHFDYYRRIVNRILGCIQHIQHPYGNQLYHKINLDNSQRCMKLILPV